MGRYDGKVAFITGGARGQGRSHALHLAREGADIIAVDLCGAIDTVPYQLGTAEDLAETAKMVEALDRRIFTAAADVRDSASVAAVARAGVAELGHGLDIVLCNAGILSFADPLEMSDQMWDDVIAVNLSGVWKTMKATFPLIKEGGRGGAVVVTSSVAGLRGNAGANMHYGAAKSALTYLVQSMALVGAPDNIRVNAVAPSNCKTDMLLMQPLYQLFRPDLEHPTVDDVRPGFEAMHPLRTPWIEPEDVSNAVLWLCSQEARWTTGILLPVDAGAGIKR